MKNIFLGVISFFCFYQSEAQVAFGIQGGLGFSRQNYEFYSDYEGDNTPYEKNPNYIPVPIITGIIDIPLSETFSIRPGIGLRQQGYSIIDFNTRLTFLNNTGSFTHKILEARLNYLEMPVNISIKLPFNNRKVEILTGITFAACLGGQAETTYRTYTTGNIFNFFPTPIDETTTSKSPMFATKFHGGHSTNSQSESVNYINRFNCNLNVGLGYTMNEHFIINATVNYGLTNMSPVIHSEYFVSYQRGYINSLSYSFTVAYMFGRKDIVEK